MEKDYSRYSQEQLADEEQALKHKLNNAQDVLEGIARPDFVEKRRLQKPHSNPRWLEKFNLQGLEGDAYFNKLGKDIIPIQFRLKRRSIPGFQENLGQVHEEFHIRTSTEVLNLIMEDPSFNLEKAMTMLVGTSTPKPLTPQKALEDLTHTVDVLEERGRLRKLDQEREEVLEKISIFSNFKQDLKDWFGNFAPKKSNQALAQRQETLLPSEDLTTLTNRIIGLVPESTISSWFTHGTPTRQQYQRQAIDFARLSLQVKEAGEPSFNPMEIVNTPDAQKLEVAQTAIRRILSQMITAYPQKQLGELHLRWGNKLRELIDWLGGGGARLVRSSSKSTKRPINEETKSLIIQAIDNLPEVERALVLEISSLNLLEDLGYLDLDECNEEIFATYLRNAAFEPNIEERDDNFEQLILTAIERSDAGTLDLAQVIDFLTEPPYEPLIIMEMIESAKVGDFRFSLIEFFASHPETSGIAHRLQRELLEEDPDEKELSYKRGEFLNRRPRYRRQ